MLTITIILSFVSVFTLVASVCERLSAGRRFVQGPTMYKGNCLQDI